MQVNSLRQVMKRALAGPWLRRLVPLAAIYVVIVAATHYAYFGDTMGYVQDILRFDRDPVANQRYLWDFGHILLRPLGWLLFRVFGNMFSYTKAGESRLTIAALLVCVSILSGLIALILLRSLAERFLGRGWMADLVAIAFLCFHAVLNWVQTGASYIVGLMWLTLSLWATVRAAESGKARWYGILSGAAAALAVLSWLPYIIAIPALLTASLLWPRRDGGRTTVRHRITGAAITCASTGLLISLVYIVPLVRLDIHSVASLKQWVGSSSHGLVQNKQLLRMASGLPRSFLWIGNEGTLIKRYLLRDPYARVTIFDILGQFWRIVVFYIAAGCLLWVLFRSKDGRRVLLILAAGAVPVLFFAVFIFESGAAERYLPMYPFLCLSIAFCLSRYRQNRVAVAGILAFLSIAALLNLTALRASSVLAWHRATEERALSLEHRVGPQGLVVVVSLMDDLYQLVSFFPFDPAVRRTSLPMYDVVVTANERVHTWRQDFAREALRPLSQGHAVWLSKRLLATRPEPSWGWTEGDDPNISWKDLRPFFSQLTYASDVGGPDGFLQIADSERNKTFLDEVIVH